MDVATRGTEHNKCSLLRHRMEVAVQGWCDVECEDQLQHTISSHLDAQHASQHVDLDVISTKAVMQNFAGPAQQAAAVYLHLQLAEMMDKYSQQQQHRKWFDTYDF